MRTTPSRVRHLAKRGFWRLVPLGWRKRALLWADGIPRLRRPSLSFLLVGDLDERDGEAYFRFVWSGHLAEAREFRGFLDASHDRLLPTRPVLLGDLARFLGSRGVDPHRIVRSVLDLGCNEGSLLRFVEQQLFESADELVGVDLDSRSIAKGQADIAREGSKVRLHCRDVTDVGGLFGDRHFDIVFCTGVLMYLTQASAQRVVEWMLEHGSLVVMTDIAHPDVDNGKLVRSERRFDHGYLHNLDEMATIAGGSILYHRWEGAHDIAGFSIYFVFASRPDAPAPGGVEAPPLAGGGAEPDPTPT